MSATIKIGKTKYKVALTFQAIADIEEKSGVNLMRRGPHGLDTRQFAVFIWGCIAPDKNGSKPSLKEIQDQLDLPTIIELHDTLIAVWADAFPEPEFGTRQANEAYEAMKAYFRIAAKRWPDGTFNEMRSLIDRMEAGQTPEPDEAETAEGNEPGTGTITSQ